MSEDEDYSFQELRRFSAPPEAAGERLDKWIAVALADVSRTRVQALIEEGAVKLEGAAVTDVKHKVRAGAEYSISIPPPEEASPIPQNIPLDVLFEDEHLIVLNKPPHFSVHPGPGHPDGTLVNALLHHCAGQLSGIGGVARPGIVHRLDMDTSGVMVAAKTDAAHQGLSAFRRLELRAPDQGGIAEDPQIPAPSPLLGKALAQGLGIAKGHQRAGHEPDHDTCFVRLEAQRRAWRLMPALWQGGRAEFDLNRPCN